MRGIVRSGKNLVITITAIFVVFSFVSVVHASPISQENVIKLTNQLRIQNNLPELIVSDELNRAAQRKAEDIVKRNYWSHQTPDGQPFWSFVDEKAYNWSNLGENLAADFKNSENMVSAWYASPSHKKNILNNDYQDIGVGIYQNTVAVAYGQKNESLAQNYISKITGYIHNIMSLVTHSY
ncbi:MAG: CAP domain-containing protein [Candidatus Berkelbacteria bacterium]|nr:CAP domain-containing protein [Candidatus Berkelbacteria bacterium]